MQYAFDCYRIDLGKIYGTKSFYVGKDGIVPGTIKQASDALEAREIIKCAVQQGCPLSAREALNQLCAELDAEPVQCIGRRFVMYRPSKENPRIVLE